MQRDLYSAFLAWCVGDDGLLHDLARKRWVGAEPLLRAAWSRALQPASGRLVPSSFGAAPRSQSGSPAQERIAKAEAWDAVAYARAYGESPGEAAVVPLETPWLEPWGGSAVRIGAKTAGTNEAEPSKPRWP